MLTDELLKLMKDKGTWLVSTDFPEAHIAALDPIGNHIWGAGQGCGCWHD